MKSIKHLGTLKIFLAILVLSSCSKPHETTPVPDPPPPPPSVHEFTVDNKWECEVDGIKYNGTIDTSTYTVFVRSPDDLDTTRLISGTSYDKKVNILFKFHLNRMANSSKGEIDDFGATIVFDNPTSAQFLSTSPYSLPDQIFYNIDTLSSNKLKATFRGILIDPNIINTGVTHAITNGKFSCEFGKGNNEPKTYSFDNDNKNFAGYVHTARLITNTLILEGVPYDGWWSAFKIQIRTGGTIRPGVYKNVSGDASFQYYSPSIFRDFINDTLGSLEVTIKSVTNNIVHGSFTGVNEFGNEYKNISNGQFTCRVQDYVPQVDSANKWSMSTNSGYMTYNIYGGNMLNAVESESAGRYYLTLKGESDFGTSELKMVVSSNDPVSTGIYSSTSSINRLDVLNFNSNTQGSKTGFYVNDSPVTFCKIDFIDDKTVRGTIYGKITNYTGGNTLGTLEIKQGRFQASIQ